LEEIDFGRMRTVLQRHWRFIVVVGLILGTAVAAAVLTLPNSYTAEAVLIVDPRQQPRLGAAGADDAAAQAVDPGLIRSEIELITDTGVVIDVIKNLDLMGDPEFAKLAAAPTPRPWSPSYWVGLLRELGIAAPERDRGDPSTEPVLRLAKALAKHATVVNDPRSYVLHLQFDWTDRDTAARIANAWTQTYLAHQLAAKYESANRTGGWLKERTAELQDKAHQSERAVQEFRDAHRLLEVKGSTVILQQLNELNTQLVLASADRAQKEGVLAQVQAQGKRGVSDSATAVLASPLIQRMREQEADASRRLADLLTTYGEQHPLVRQARSQIADVEGKIRNEIGKVAASSEADVRAARGREEELKRQIERIRQEAVAADGDQVRLRQFEREAQADQALLQQFMLQSKEMDTREGIERPPARLVSAALRPDVPSFPNRMLFIALGFAASFSISSVAAFGRERLTRRFVDPTVIESALGAALLGTVPEIRPARGATVSDYVVRWPRSEFGESVHTVRTRLYAVLAGLPGGARPAGTGRRSGRVVLVTSAMPAEGKTTIAVSLARSAALNGAKTLLVDADVRRPAVREALRSEVREGQERAVVQHRPTGDRDFDEMLAFDSASGLHYVSAAEHSEDPQEALGSHALGDFIEEARKHYDLVLIDSPPVLVVSDAVVLSGFADAVVYIMRWERTPRAAVLGAVKALRQGGAAFAGIVLSRVDTSRMLDEWVAHTGVAHGRYGVYYEQPRKPPGRAAARTATLPGARGAAAGTARPRGQPST
jgi:succinoglycan biosynthesis transport protein ExoP